MSTKEVIALKRAEAKKAMAAQKALSEHGGLNGFEDMLPTSAHAADEDDLGRLSMRETIERARSSGVHIRTLRFVYHSTDPSGHAPKVHSTSRHATFYVFPLPYSRSTSPLHPRSSLAFQMSHHFQKSPEKRPARTRQRGMINRI